MQKAQQISVRLDVVLIKLASMKISLRMRSIVLLFNLTLRAQSLPGVSLKLTQTFSDCELVSSEPFSIHGLLALRTKDTVELWNTQTRTVAATLPVKGKVLKASFSVDGDTFITSFKEKKVVVTKLWDAQSGRLTAVMDGLVVFGPTGQTLITLDGKQLKFWNAETGALQKTVTAYKRSFENSNISPDGQVVLRWGASKAFLWDAGTGRLKAELEAPVNQRDYLVPWWLTMLAGPSASTSIYYPEFSPDSKLIATPDTLNRIELWDAATGQMRALLEGHGSTVYDLRFSPDGQLLASASRDGTARIWDVRTGTQRAMLRAGDEIARRVLFSPDGSLLAVGYHTQARIWDVASGQLKATLAKHRDVNKAVVFGTYRDAIEIALSPRDDLLISQGDKVVNLWDVKSGQLVQTLAGARRPAVFSADGKLLVTRGRDHTVLLWSIEKS